MKIATVALVTFTSFGGIAAAQDLSPAARDSYARIDKAIKGKNCAQAEAEFAAFKQQAPAYAKAEPGTMKQVQSSIDACKAQPYAGKPGTTRLKGESEVN